MSDVEKHVNPPERRPITDSPWFWLVLFGSSALVAIVVVSPKYAYRQARLERMNSTREQIARGQVAEALETADPDALITDLPRDSSRQFTLGPLATALALLLALAAVGAGVHSYLKSASRRVEGHKPRPRQ
ncbi:MAG TPA: hypothetical protein VGG64_23680 [Pirellulales bacterium]|jgi:hypothetical protein